jgi:hypothetical protein
MENEPKNRDWVQWLSEKLEFPFEVERVDDNDEYVLFGNPTENEPFRLGHVFKVVSIEDFDEFYGLILKCREGRRIGYVPLLDLDITEKEHKNNQPIDEFLNWYSEHNG